MKDIDVNNIEQDSCSLIFNKKTEMPDYLSYIILDNRPMGDELLYEVIVVNYDIFRETLFHLFYYYPDVDILDDNNISYLKENIDFNKLSQLYEEFKIYIINNITNIITNIAIIEKYTANCNKK